MIYLYLFLISMVPIIELRGAICIAVIYDANLILSMIVCIIGNNLVMPIIFIFAKKFLYFLKEFKYTNKFAEFFIQKGHKSGEKLLKKSKNGIYLALLLFVGIPLPGTGVWTGTLAASLLDLDLKKSFVATFLGTILACVIMLVASLIGINLYK